MNQYADEKDEWMNQCIRWLVWKAWMDEPMHRGNGWMNQYIDEMDEWMNQCIDEKDEWMNKWNRWIKYWTKEWIKEWFKKNCNG